MKINIATTHRTKYIVDKLAGLNCIIYELNSKSIDNTFVLLC